MQETEAKFYVQDLKRIRSSLEELGAHLIHERVLESNIRFDLPGQRLRAQGRVLRLRHDTETKLTYKGASEMEQGILSREEIEFVVEDFEKARRFLEALGYQKLVYYEKYRITYEIQSSDVSPDLGGLLHVMLDEMPYGSFVEIEGETIESIHAVATKLHLNWDTAIATSYHVLFERLCQALDLRFQDISFANFTGVKVTADELGVRAADG